MRFDLTVPLARFIAMNPTLKMPFKRYEVGPVFRDGPIKMGRTRQFWQCDADIIGSKSMLAEAELLSIVQTVFNELNLKVVIKVNNRKLLNGILDQVKIENKEETIISIDKLSKIGVSGVSKELKEKGLKKKQIDSLFSLIKEGVTLKELKKIVTNEEALEGICELEEVFNYLKQQKVKDAVFDVSLARGLAYYTGMVCEVFLRKGKITSSLLGGGRWDEMIGNFMGSKRIVPAVGISFGLVPIIETLKETEINRKSPSKVFVIPINTQKESLSLLQDLRLNEIPSEISLAKKGVSKNLQYANALGIPFAVILWPEEVKKSKFLLRDMDSGAEQQLTLKQLILKLK